MEEDISVTEVVIYNRQDNCCEERLSGATVSLLDSNDNVIGTYRIGDTSSISMINISATDFHVVSFFDQIQFPLGK